MSADSSNLSRLITERDHILKLIEDLCSQPYHSSIQIALLQQKSLNITNQIDAECIPHKWGDEEWGYIHCEVCGKKRATKHT
jgi:hypothetical protein